MTASTTSSGGLELDGVRIFAPGGALLLALDAEVPPGGVLTVMGPSGSGKTTLLAFVAGFLPPAFRAEGRVLLDGAEVTALPPERRRVGLLFQDALLFPHLSVADNVAFGLPAAIRGRRARRTAADALLAEVGLEGFGPRDPRTLSGGQAARAALVRTLAAEPRALLLDEPFSRLDQALRAQVRALVVGEARRRGLPTLLVTHDPADAEAAGGSLARLG